MLTDHQGNASIELASGLAEEVVRTHGEVRLRAFGTSMVPSILPGDLVSIRRASLHEIFPGEVVLFSQNRRLFIHRVVGRKVVTAPGNFEELFLITRGDRLRQDDPPVSSPELLGRVVTIERDTRKVNLLPNGSNRMVRLLLQSSDRMTYLYVRLAAFWPALFPRRAKCQA
jgi:hypothetical protein